MQDIGSGEGNGQTKPTATSEKFIPSHLKTYHESAINCLLKLGISFSTAETGTDDWVVDGAERSLLSRFRGGLQARVDAGQNQGAIADDLGVVKRPAVTNFLSEKVGLSTRSLAAIKVVYNIPFPAHKDMVAEGTVDVVNKLAEASGSTEATFDVEGFWLLYRLFNEKDWLDVRSRWGSSRKQEDYARLEAIAGGIIQEVRIILGRAPRAKNADDLSRLMGIWGEIYIAAVHLVRCKLSRDRHKAGHGTQTEFNR